MMTAAALAGCYLPKPVNHAELRISSEGQYAFNGLPVQPQNLQLALDAAKRPGQDLIVQIEAAPTANLVFVRRAIDTVKLAHARVAFTKDYTPQ